jgi:hypothetical protein
MNRIWKSLIIIALVLVVWMALGRPLPAGIRTDRDRYGDSELSECQSGCSQEEAITTEDYTQETTASHDGSCVVRIEPGEKADVFTETWDAETRVWIYLNGGTCEGPYCFSMDQCEDPLAALHRQPFWTGHELSPVNNEPFQACYDFAGECSR